MSESTLTDEQVIDELRKDSSWNKARKILRAFAAKAEKNLDPISARRLEFETTKEIIKIFNTEIKLGD